MRAAEALRIFESQGVSGLLEALHYEADLDRRIAYDKAQGLVPTKTRVSQIKKLLRSSPYNNLKGAWVKDGQLMFTDRVSAFLFKGCLDGIPMLEEEPEGADVLAVFSTYKSGLDSTVEIDWGALTIYFKELKKIKKSAADASLVPSQDVLLGESVFDGERLLEVYKIMGGGSVSCRIHGGAVTKPLYLENEECNALLMPKKLSPELLEKVTFVAGVAQPDNI